MVPFSIVIGEILLLFFLGNEVKKRLFLLSYRVTKNKSTTITLVSLLLYPGVVLHELSHLVTAAVLFVPVQSMSLIPKVVDGRLRGGSVTIEKVDPVRRTIVGIAPLFVGITMLWLIAVYVLPPIPFFCNNITPLSCNSSPFPFPQFLSFFISLFLIFSISLTMYSSKADLTALFYTIPILLVIVAIAYVLGVQGAWVVNTVENFKTFFQNMILVLCIPLGIQTLSFCFLFILLKR